MKIKGTCGNCGRELLVEQVVRGDGACPWCGRPFNRDYTGVIAETLREAELVGSQLEAALDRLAGIDMLLEIDEDSLLGPLRAALREHRRHRSRV